MNSSKGLIKSLWLAETHWLLPGKILNKSRQIASWCVVSSSSQFQAKGYVNVISDPFDSINVCGNALRFRWVCYGWDCKDWAYIFAADTKMRRCARKFVYGSAIFYVELLRSKQFYDLICFEWQQYPVCFALRSTLLRLLKLDEIGCWFFYTHTKAVTRAITFQKVLKIYSLDTNQELQGTNV